MVEELFRFIEQSPSSFHAVDTICGMLKEAGFMQLAEAEEWQLTAGGKYFVVRNGISP